MERDILDRLQSYADIAGETGRNITDIWVPHLIEAICEIRGLRATLELLAHPEDRKAIFKSLAELGHAKNAS